MREVLVLPARQVLPIPTAIGDVAGCIVSEIATAVHLCRRCGFRAGMSVAVVGTGRHGQHTIRVARSLGAARIAGIDPSGPARAAALGCGAHEVQGDLPMSGDFDLVVHCTTDTSCVGQCCDLVRPGGTLALFGTPRAQEPDVEIARFAARIVMGERRLVGSASKGTASFRAAITMMRDPAFGFEPASTETVTIAEAPARLRSVAQDWPEGTPAFVRMDR